MTTNHPAHGPVSLDRLHQISEILSKAASQSDGGNLGYAIADAVKVIDWAISSFGAEPVAWIVHAMGGDQLTNDGDYVANAEGIGGISSTPLYIAPPAQVVPFALPVQHWEELCRQNPDMSIGDAIIRAAWWNHCAAMLQAGNSPVIPDGWIPVSERMPPNKPGSYEYIVFDSLNNKAHHDYWNVPDGSCDDFSPFWNHYGKYVTHWMPLPAAPQEVKSE